PNILSNWSILTCITPPAESNMFSIKRNTKLKYRNPDYDIHRNKDYKCHTFFYGAHQGNSVTDPFIYQSHTP
ncbi:hypothetical protein L1D44_12435, partial [Shewanella sp. Isolate13]|uniref:hypothetical protein n=1 Tax=Shewanella sp. Isolate13 TaxID=2908531 RepID=UPI001EFE4CDF